MFLTMMIALELETFPSFQSLKRHTDSLDPYVLRMLVLSSCMYLSIHACAVKHPSAKAAARCQLGVGAPMTLGIMLVLIHHAGRSLLLSLCSCFVPCCSLSAFVRALSFTRLSFISFLSLPAAERLSWRRCSGSSMA